MYFNESEAAALCDNIRRLLIKYDGCWITSELKPEVAETVRRGMEQCAYWKITLSDDVKTVSGEGDNADFKVRAMLTEGRLDLYLSGRMDTLTAPQVLELFEKRRRIQMLIT